MADERSQPLAGATRGFLAYIEVARETASAKGLAWSLSISPSGRVVGDGWDMNRMVGRVGTGLHLRDFSAPGKVPSAIEDERRERSLQDPTLESTHRVGWCELIKAYVVQSLLIAGLTPIRTSTVVQGLRTLAACARGEPWQFTRDEARFALRVATRAQPSGGLRRDVEHVLLHVLDGNHISECGPLGSAAEESNEPETEESHIANAAVPPLEHLSARKRDEQLPRRRAFWEFIRIIFTERPRTFNDYVRFAVGRVAVMTGLRAQETSANIPVDWLRPQHHFDSDGTPAGERGGISTSTRLRYFAVKTGLQRERNTVLFEETQDIPQIFEATLAETLEDVKRKTAPLRATLELQFRTKRQLPWFGRDQVVPATDLYPVLTGNPVWLELDDVVAKQIYERYLASGFDTRVFRELEETQRAAGAYARKNDAFYVYFNRLMKSGKVVIRDVHGTQQNHSRIRWDIAHFHIGELEDFLGQTKESKNSDIYELPISGGGSHKSFESLLLHPKRALGERRDGSLIDISRYHSVGVIDTQIMQTAVSGDHSLFKAYGQTDEDRELSIEMHDFRHLQNAELLRWGVSDAIVTKRFGRHGLAQTHEYDHRSLEESLESVDLPEQWTKVLGESRAALVAKLIQAGAASGPIVSEFKRLQKEEGDDAALLFLRAEADGFHSTPYGHCLSNLGVDPCPKHLECFMGCRHLTSTGISKHREAAVKLHGRLKLSLEAALASPSGSVGRKNHIESTRTKLEGVERLMSTQAGQRVFPMGRDLSRPPNPSVLDGSSSN